MANEEHVAIVRAYAEGDREQIDDRWRKNHPSSRLDLSGAKLEEVNLTNVNLTNVNLTGANLTKVYLTGADLTGADLAGVNFQRSHGTPRATRKQMEYISTQRKLYEMYCAIDD